MLYGEENVWKKILHHGEVLADERECRIVYAAVTGSISRGISVWDSDYDIRFLFIKKDFPEKKYDPKICKENDIIFRYFRDTNHQTDIDISYTYDRMAFWELSSFLSLLVEPQIGNETWDVNGLYYITEHTFLSPYTWDPYGIQQRVVPFIYRYAKPQYSCPYYRNIINKANSKPQMRAKDYVDALWAALSLEWLKQYGGPAPVDFETLATIIADVKQRNYIREWVYTTLDVCNCQFEKNGNNRRSFSRENVICKRNKEIDAFLNNGIAISECAASIKSCCAEPLTVQKLQINTLIDAIARGILHQPHVMGILM